MQRPIADVQRDHERELLAIPGVVGIGIGECDGTPCLRVLADRLTSANRARIPTRLEGFRVEVEDTGEIRARDTLPNMRPYRRSRDAGDQADGAGQAMRFHLSEEPEIPDADAKRVRAGVSGLDPADVGFPAAHSHFQMRRQIAPAS